MYCPAAVQERPEVHEIPAKPPCDPPFVSKGVWSSTQFVPFHISTSVPLEV